MSEFITAIYKGLLSSTTLSASAQEQILRYAVEGKEYNLIEDLLQNPNLTSEVDGRIGKLPASKVKAAWLRRPGRSAPELEKLVETYSSQSVLLDLIRTTGMPSELYAAVVTKSSQKAVLREIATSDHIDEPVKISAVMKLAQILPADLNLGKEGNVTEFYLLVQQYPSLAQSIASSTKNIPLALAALGFGELSVETESRVLEMCTTALEKITSSGAAERKAGTQAPLYSVPLLSQLAVLLSSRAGFDEGEVMKIVKLAQPLKKEIDKNNKNNRYHNFNSFDGYIKLLESAWAPRKAETGYAGIDGHSRLLLDLGACKNSASLVKIINMVLEIKNSIEQDYALKTALLNEHLTSDILGDVASNFSTTKIREEFLAELSQTDKWPLWLAGHSWDLTDAELRMSKDPAATLVALADAPELHNPYILQVLVDSVYLTEGLIPKVPAALFTAPKIPSAVAAALDGVLSSKLLTSNDWQSFESMAEDYKGSVGDLIQVISPNQ